MRDAFGGSVNLFLIMVFIAIALGYVAFNVNYTKAFKMKDKVVSVYEKYKGDCSSDCEKEISDYAKRIAYNSEGLECGSDYEEGDPYPYYYCIKAVDVTYSDGGLNTTSTENERVLVNDRNTKCYYKIKTRVHMSIPIIGNINVNPSWDVFTVKGDTKAIEIDGTVCKK